MKILYFFLLFVLEVLWLNVIFEDLGMGGSVNEEFWEVDDRGIGVVECFM